MKKNFEVSISLLVLDVESAEDAYEQAAAFVAIAKAAWNARQRSRRNHGHISDDVVVCDPSEVFEDNRSEVA